MNDLAIEQQTASNRAESEDSGSEAGSDYIASDGESEAFEQEAMAIVQARKEQGK